MITGLEEIFDEVKVSEMIVNAEQNKFVLELFVLEHHIENDFKDVDVVINILLLVGFLNKYQNEV